MHLLNSPTKPDDEDFDRRPQRRRYEEPLSSRIRRQLLSIAESPHKRPEDDVRLLAKTISDNYDDVEMRASFLQLALQIVVEQPFKIPFVAGVVVVLNGLNRGEEAVEAVLAKAAADTEEAIARGQWRTVKLLLKFLGSLQGLLEEDGVFGVLTELFERAVDLQTASSDDVSIPIANRVDFVNHSSDFVRCRLLERSWSRSFFSLFLILWLHRLQNLRNMWLVFSTKRTLLQVHHTRWRRLSTHILEMEETKLRSLLA